MNRIAAVAVSAATIAIAFASLPPAAARTEASEVSRADALDTLADEISARGFWDGAQGAWKTKAQLVFHPKTNLLERRTFTVWDPAPSLDLDFVWTPSDAAVSGGAIVSGEGTLVWRARNRPPYDPTAIVSVYQGAMVDGRPQGYGEYRDAGGLVYSGNWSGGVSQGQGRLDYPNGDEYRGSFAAGRPSGQGRYTDSTGEIYEGGFVDGRRQGSATTTLTNGSSYRSQWQAGKELAQSRSLRLAQLGNGTAGAEGGARDDIRIGIQVDPVSPDDYLFHDDMAPVPRAPLSDEDRPIVRDNALGYSRSNAGSAIVIGPKNKRLMGMWKGSANISLTSDEEDLLSRYGDLSYGVFSLGETLLPPPRFVAEVQNRSASPIQVTGMYLDVASSQTDSQPALQITAGADMPCNDLRNHKDYSPALKVENFGWGAARNAEMRYALENPMGGSSPGKSTVKPIGNVRQSARVNFEPALRVMGFRPGTKVPDRLAKMWNGDLHADDRNASHVESEIDSEIQASKLFGSASGIIAFQAGNFTTDVVGTIAYDWTDANGGEHHRQSPFHSTITLGGLRPAPECGEGAAIERVQHKSVLLRNDAQGYRLAVPFARAVPAGRVARYSVAIDAERASEHKFSLVVQLADGREIRSRPIDMLYFKPSRTPQEGF